MSTKHTSTRRRCLHEWGSRLVQWTCSKLSRAKSNFEKNALSAPGIGYEIVAVSGTSRHWYDQVLQGINQIYENGPTMSSSAEMLQSSSQEGDLVTDGTQNVWLSYLDLPMSRSDQHCLKETRFIRDASLSVKRIQPSADGQIDEGPKTDSISQNVTHDSSDEEEFYDAAVSFSFPFMSLPYEMRHEVFKQVLPPLYYTKRTPRQRGRTTIMRAIYKKGLNDNPLLNLMLTCHQLHTEISRSLPRIVQIHVQTHEDLGLPGPSLRPGLPTYMYTSFWYLAPTLRQAQVITGQWTRRWGESLPSIPLELLYQNTLKWRRVKMMVNIRVDKAHAGKAFMCRFRDAVVRTRMLYRDLDGYIRFGTRNGLHVSVLLRFEDQGLGCHLCSLLVCSRRVVAVTTYLVGLDAEELSAVVRDVFHLG